jgi:hypothetical protein
MSSEHITQLENVVEDYSEDPGTMKKSFLQLMKTGILSLSKPAESFKTTMVPQFNADVQCWLLSHSIICYSN